MTEYQVSNLRKAEKKPKNMLAISLKLHEKQSPHGRCLYPPQSGYVRLLARVDLADLRRVVFQNDTAYGQYDFLVALAVTPGGSFLRESAHRFGCNVCISFCGTFALMSIWYSDVHLICLTAWCKGRMAALKLCQFVEQ